MLSINFFFIFLQLGSGLEHGGGRCDSGPFPNRPLWEVGSRMLGNKWKVLFFFLYSSRHFMFLAHNSSVLENKEEKDKGNII